MKHVQVCYELGRLWFLPVAETSSKYYGDIWKQEGGIGSHKCLPQK